VRRALLAIAALTAIGASALAPVAHSADSKSREQAPSHREGAAPVGASLLATAAAGRFAGLALSCVHREYPNKISHVLRDAGDALQPHELTPAFYGCLDWHSAVHGHWLLARLARTYPAAPFAIEAKAALATSLTPENLAAELRYLQAPGRTSFERPYGLAWLLALSAELHAWDDPQAREWAKTIEPLESEVATRLNAWLNKLRRPNRSGEHAQTAFAMGLVADWAAARGASEVLATVRNRAAVFYANDRRCPLDYEPAGEDFLSACLGEADLMRRVLGTKDYAKWLAGFLPQVPRHSFGHKGAWLPPEPVVDRTDPKMAHIDGLNLSRAWMLRGVAQALPARDPRRKALLAAAVAHRAAALPAVTGEHYEGGHWLGTFAVMLETGGVAP
jgi:Protein of unknown function (DUF2891)